tara:strand:- start:1254 stop:1634 length:381 start_codon:yes stop_codon:yes gene_type:complete
MGSLRRNDFENMLFILQQSETGGCKMLWSDWDKPVKQLILLGNGTFTLRGWKGNGTWCFKKGSDKGDSASTRVDTDMKLCLKGYISHYLEFKLESITRDEWCEHSYGYGHKSDSILSKKRKIRFNK